MQPTVIITGAGSGIGAATARLFSDHGYHVVLVGRRLERLNEVAQHLRTKSLCISQDITAPGAAELILDKSLNAFGKIHSLVNNAGTYKRGGALATTDDIWTEMFQIHVLAPARLSQQVSQQMIKQGHGGSIVNVSSSAALRPIPEMWAYGSMKAAMNYMTQNMARELASHKIRVNAVCPGIVQTEILGLERLPAAEKEKTIQGMAKLHPLQRLGQPLDVAQVIYDLAKLESSWLTGVLVPIDGGVSLV